MLCIECVIVLLNMTKPLCEYMEILALLVLYGILGNCFAWELDFGV